MSLGDIVILCIGRHKNSDFIGEKVLTVGTIVEAEVYDEQLYEIWISPVEREFVFSDELEFL
jgi:hypothetical protein